MTRSKTQAELKITPEQILLGIHIRELGMLPEYERKVCEDRDWRFDVVILDTRVACEISGGNWSGGHRRGKDQETEYDKLNRAQMEGWRVLQFTNAQVNDGRAKQFLAEYVGRGASTTGAMIGRKHGRL